MRRLLVINPNTSSHVTALLQHHAQAAAGVNVQVQTVTARFGAPYIACEASYAVAAHALLESWADALQDATQPPDAVLIGCFGDPGLMALRQLSQVPVTGLAEAAFAQAAAHGPFAVVTGGARWKPMLERLAFSLGYADTLAGIHTVVPSGAELASDPEAAIALLAQACQDAATRWNVNSIILGGAGLAGMAAAVQSQVSVPVIDSVIAGTQYALSLPALAQDHPAIDLAWVGMGAALTAQSLVKKA
jgi:allantoin racemase